MNKWIILAFSALFLIGCSDQQSEGQSEAQIEEVKGATVGFSMADDGSIEEASGVPEDEKQKILALFEEYIQAFNDKDIERYMATIAKNPKGFDYNEEREYTLSTFDVYDILRTVEDLTIVKYNETEAQVHANITVQLKELETGNEVESVGKQVTVLVKEDGKWGISSVHGMMENN